MAEDDDEREVEIDRGSIKIIEREKKDDKEGFQFSLLLFIAGIAWFYLRDFLPLEYLPFSVQPWDSVFFLLFVSLLVFKGKGVVTNVALVILFLAIRNINVLFIVSASIIIAGYIGFRGIYKYHGDIGKAVSDELLSLIPLGIFFFDLVAIWNVFNLSRNNPILTILGGLPLWGLLGAVLWIIESGSIKKRREREGKGLTWFETFSLVAAFIAIIFFAFGNALIALAGTGGYNLIDVDELGADTSNQLQKKTSAWKEIQWKVECATSGQAANLKECIDRHRAEEQCEEFKNNPLSYKDCMNKVMGLKEDSKPTGGVDPKEREPTELKIEKADRFPSSIAQNQAMDFKLIFKNPRRQEVRGRSYCEVKSAGNVIAGSVGVYDFKKELEQKEFACEPSGEWPKGRVSVAVSFVVEGLETSMGLHRVYVGEQKEENKKRDENLKSQWASEALGSNDPVWLDFKIGDEVLIRDDPRISAYVVNRMDGKIEQVEGGILLVDYPEDITLVETPSCKLVKDGEVLVNPDLGIEKEEKEYQYASCKTTLSEELKNPKVPLTAFYLSYIKYDYKIKEEFSVTVT